MKSLLLAILFLVLAIVIVGVIALGGREPRRRPHGDEAPPRLRDAARGRRQARPGQRSSSSRPSSSSASARPSTTSSRSPSWSSTRANGVLTIEPACDDYPDVVPCFSDMRITVPPGVKVTVDGGRGDVDLRAIDVRAAHVETGSGDIELGVIGRPGLLWAHSDSGDVELVAASARAVDVRSSSGDVHVDVAAKPRRVARAQRRWRHRARAAARDLRHQDEGVGSGDVQRARAPAQRRIGELDRRAHGRRRHRHAPALSRGARATSARPRGRRSSACSAALGRMSKPWRARTPNDLSG